MSRSRAASSLLVLIACTGCVKCRPCAQAPAFAADGCVASPRILAGPPSPVPPPLPAPLPSDVVVDEDEDDDDTQDYEPVLSNDPGETSAVAPKDLFERAKSILSRSGIDAYAECAVGRCWVAVPSVDADRAVRLLSADPTLAPFAGRGVEVVEGQDSRVLRSLSRSVAERAADALRRHRVDPMVEDHAGVFEVWVDRSSRDAAMQALQLEPQLRVYVAKRKYGRDQAARPGAVGD